MVPSTSLKVGSLTSYRFFERSGSFKVLTDADWGKIIGVLGWLRHLPVLDRGPDIGVGSIYSNQLYIASQSENRRSGYDWTNESKWFYHSFAEKKKVMVKTKMAEMPACAQFVAQITLYNSSLA